MITIKMRYIFAILCASSLLSGFMAWGIMSLLKDNNVEDCIVDAAKSAPSNSGFRYLAALCERTYDTQVPHGLIPFNGELDKK